jgi:hypothetical protein
MAPAVAKIIGTRAIPYSSGALAVSPWNFFREVPVSLKAKFPSAKTLAR